jgi:hypothetical protein
MEYGPLNRMTETTEGLKSGVAPAGGHFCGVQPLNRVTKDAEVLKSSVASAGRHFCGAQRVCGRFMEYLP